MILVASSISWRIGSSRVPSRLDDTVVAKASEEVSKAVAAVLISDITEKDAATLATGHEGSSSADGQAGDAAPAAPPGDEQQERGPVEPSESVFEQAAGVSEPPPTESIVVQEATTAEPRAVLTEEQEMEQLQRVADQLFAVAKAVALEAAKHADEHAAARELAYEADRVASRLAEDESAAQKVAAELPAELSKAQEVAQAAKAEIAGPIERVTETATFAAEAGVVIDEWATSRFPATPAFCAGVGPYLCRACRRAQVLRSWGGRFSPILH